MNGVTKPVAAPTPSRMKIANLVKGVLRKPRKLMLVGPEGIGKTTFGVNAPKPIFLGAEDGTDQHDVARFPRPETEADVLDAIRELQTVEHDFETLVIDTVDWIEPLIFNAVVAGDKDAKSIEEVGGGYGKGFTKAVEHWRVILKELEVLREKRRMNIVLLSHTKVRSFNNPEGENYDRYELAMNEKAAAVLKQWVDDLLFANYETYVNKGKGFAKNKGIDTGARVIHTNRRAAFDAKNRHGLPDTLPLSWGDYDAAVEAHQPASPAALREEIERKAKEVGGDIEKQALDALAKFANDAQKLVVLNNRLNAKLAEKSALEEPQNA